MSPDKPTGDWVRSALPMLLLRFLAERPMHGYALMEGLRASGFDVRGATVYPHLNRLSEAGEIESRWHAPESGPARKIMTITDDGRKRLRDLQDQWAQFQNQIDAVLTSPAAERATTNEENE
ncbi:PadR family transcriptional regulator [Herbiconiux liukaitaii]|uniref:PadR family transcriptional regulator n=1 Tax=Herbiconiux liukaitaii TaxID=3342799 RepID=UPI0035B72917